MKAFLQRRPGVLATTDDKGRTPLALACYRGRYDLARVILQFDKDVSILGRQDLKEALSIAPNKAAA